MAKYTIEYTEEAWRYITIEAESEEQARNKFWQGEYDEQEAYQFGGCIQDGFSVKLATNEEANA